MEINTDIAELYSPVVEFSHPDDPGYKQFASEFGVVIGQVVVAVVNGHLSTHKFGEVANAVNFDAYMQDQLPAGYAGRAKMVKFNPSTAKYELV